ncbi:MAG: hypothetical protein PWP31_1113 [Clostridia bacterium]|nr:hypothetical protein [Clostridia bacterium]
MAEYGLRRSTRNLNRLKRTFYGLKIFYKKANSIENQVFPRIKGGLIFFILIGLQHTIFY